MDYPFQKETRIFVPLNCQYTINVVPDMILADDTLKYYSLKARKCFIRDKEWSHMKIFRV